MSPRLHMFSGTQKYLFMAGWRFPFPTLCRSPLTLSLPLTISTSDVILYLFYVPLQAHRRGWDYQVVEYPGLLNHMGYHNSRWIVWKLLTLNGLCALDSNAEILRPLWTGVCLMRSGWFTISLTWLFYAHWADMVVLFKNLFWIDQKHHNWLTRKSPQKQQVERE